MEPAETLRRRKPLGQDAGNVGQTVEQVLLRLGARTEARAVIHLREM